MTSQMERDIAMVIGASGDQRAAFMYSLIVTAKMSNVDPRAWLANVLARHPTHKIDELLPWNCKAARDTEAAAA